MGTARGLGLGMGTWAELGVEVEAEGLGLSRGKDELGVDWENQGWRGRCLLRQGPWGRSSHPSQPLLPVWCRRKGDGERSSASLLPAPGPNSTSISMEHGHVQVSGASMSLEAVVSVVSS